MADDKPIKIYTLISNKENKSISSLACRKLEMAVLNSPNWLYAKLGQLHKRSGFLNSEAHHVRRIIVVPLNLVNSIMDMETNNE